MVSFSIRGSEGVHLPGVARIRDWFDDPTRLASVDRAWLRMDDPTNLMVVNAMLLLAEPLPVTELRELVAARLGWIQRMRSRIVPGQPWERWLEHELDLEVHVCERQLPAPGDDNSLRELIGALISVPLDPDQPLWQLCVIHGYRRPAGPDGTEEREASVVIARVHHSLGDGLAQLMVLLSLTDLEASGRESPLRHLFLEGANIEAARSYLAKVMPTGMKLLLPRDHLREAGRDGDSGQTKGQTKGSATQAALRQLRRGAKIGGALGRDLASLVLRRPDSATVFRGPLKVPKRVAWSEPIPLAAVKVVSKRLGDTVNDVLLAALTGALRRYILARGRSPDGVEIRAAVPINLRHLGQLTSLGNRFGLVFLTLPVGIADPQARLTELHRRMDALKHSVEPVVTWGILELIGAAPKLVEDLVMAYFAQRVSFVMTNVPGPERTLYLAGREIEGVMFWVPQSGRVGLGLSIFSYAGHLRIGVAGDAGLVPEPELLVAKFHEELADLGVDMT